MSRRISCPTSRDKYATISEIIGTLIQSVTRISYATFPPLRVFPPVRIFVVVVFTTRVDLLRVGGGVVARRSRGGLSGDDSVPDDIETYEEVGLLADELVIEMV